MKKKLFLVFAIALFLSLVTWILLDMFTGTPELQKNPFDYGMKDLRKSDSVPAFSEINPVKSILPEVKCLATDLQGRIYIGGQGGVEILDASGHRLSRFSIPGLATCIAAMSDGNLAIGMEDHMEIWNPSGVRISAWLPADTGSILTSVASSDNRIYVADAGKLIVYEYDRTGQILSKIGEKDPVRKIPGFIIPSPYFDVAINSAGELWVANTGRHELERYGPDGSLLASWGESSGLLDGFCGCCNPSNFTFLSDGSFVTSEKGIERVKIYSPDGKFKALVVGPESFSEGTRGLDLAPGLKGAILVLDPSRNQVRIFIPKEKK